MALGFEVESLVVLPANRFHFFYMSTEGVKLVFVLSQPAMTRFKITQWI